jgi:hypothetical protein
MYVCTEEEKDMGAVREMKPFEINFKNDDEREEFVRWADTKSVSTNPNVQEMRKEMKKIREMRKRGRK